MPQRLYHFSEEPAIERFVPHVPRTNPSHRPAVWAIDAAHAPLYWFPRNCPRVAMWPKRGTPTERFHEVLTTVAWRLHAIETVWVERMRTAHVYCYEFDSDGFEPWEDADGQWTSDAQVLPISVAPVGDLVAAHLGAGIELRVVESLWRLRDVAIAGEFDFSIVRMHNALPRPGS
ncbi:MAG: DUF6886 family protein [Ilumatobacteraceae bacterium]